MQHRRRCASVITLAIAFTSLQAVLTSAALADGPEVDPPFRVIFWNDLGMQCMDADSSVFAILPPSATSTRR